MATGNYDDGYADGAASRSADRNMEGWFKLVGHCLVLLGLACYFSLVYSPLLFIGYQASRALPSVHQHNLYGQAALIGSVAYLVYCALFFFKGLIIRFQLRGHLAEWLLLVPCLVVACGIPALLVHVALLKWFPTLPSYCNWFGALLFAGVVYQRYHFLSPGAPALARWAYQYGVGAWQPVTTGSTATTPQV